jgi:hypothetical protein
VRTVVVDVAVADATICTLHPVKWSIMKLAVAGRQGFKNKFYPESSTMVWPFYL